MAGNEKAGRTIALDNQTDPRAESWSPVSGAFVLAAPVIPQERSDCRDLPYFTRGRLRERREWIPTLARFARSFGMTEGRCTQALCDGW
jgi:hypothetical protein